MPDPLQLLVMAMCLMGIAFAICIRSVVEILVGHLRTQSDLTTKAITQAGEAVALNGRILDTVLDDVSAATERNDG